MMRDVEMTGVELESLTLREIQLTLKEPFIASGGVQQHRRVLLLEIRTAEGFTAWSECVALDRPGYSEETVDTAWSTIRDRLAPLLADAVARQQMPAVLFRHVRGSYMAKAAIEMACWNLEAQRRRVPLAELLGGSQSRIPVGVALGMKTDPAGLVEEVLRCSEEGYRRIKLKIEPGADSRFVAAVREAVGPDVSLSVDANGSYSNADVRTLRSLDAFGLTMIEQPLSRNDLSGHAALQKEIETPLCLDESISSRSDVEEMIRLGSGRIVNVKPGRVGGLAPAREIYDLCCDSGLDVWVGGMLESGIGRAYNVALASLPNFTLPGDISPSSRYWERDIVEPEWIMSADGYIDVPFDRPGLGVDVDRDRIENLTRRVARVAL